MIPKLILLHIVIGMFVLTGTSRAALVDDIRIVIDVSGSMVNTDPENLRVPALRMLNGLIPTGSKAGVWTFGRYVKMEVKWGTVNKRWRQQADKGAAKIHSRGQFTNIESALKRVTSGWAKPDKNTRRNIILLTDGKVDVSKKPEKNVLSKNNILHKTVPELVKKGIKVHAIALSGQSDEELLKRLALKTSGSFEIARSAEDLQRIFLHMFERAASPDTVPLQGNKFTIDKSISEMTLLIFRKGDKTVRLFQPDENSHTQKRHAANVRWRHDLGYDLITVSKPIAGEWTLDAEVDEDNRVMIVTDLKLAVKTLPAYSTPDKPILLNVELYNKNKKISKNSFLKFVEFNVRHKMLGKDNNLPLKLKKSREIKDKGIYVQQVEAPLTEGSHEIIVTADARTFNRSKRFKIEVQWPVMVETSKTEQAGEFELNIKAREEYLQVDSLKLDVNLKQPDRQLKPVQLEFKNSSWVGLVKANKQDGLHSLQINVQGKSPGGKEISHSLKGYSVLGVKPVDDTDNSEPITGANDPDDKKDEEAPSADSDQQSDLFDSILMIGAINVVIILLAAGGYIYLRKKKKDGFNLIDEEAVEEEFDD